MARVITDGTPIEQNYEPPPPPVRRETFSENEVLISALSNAIAQGFRNAVAGLPAPVVNMPKPEVKINSPVYVTAPEVKIPATTVNVPEGKAPVIHVEPPNVTLQTNRPKEWEFEVTKRNDFGQIVIMRARMIS